MCGWSSLADAHCMLGKKSVSLLKLEASRELRFLKKMEWSKEMYIENHCIAPNWSIEPWWMTVSEKELESERLENEAYEEFSRILHKREGCFCGKNSVGEYVVNKSTGEWNKLIREIELLLNDGGEIVRDFFDEETGYTQFSSEKVEALAKRLTDYYISEFCCDC